MKKILKWVSLFVLAVLTACRTSFKQQQSESHSVDFDRVLWYAKRASLAYSDEKTIRTNLPNVIRVAELKDSVQYFLETDSSNKTQTISVRGTANIKNAKQDAEYIPIKDKELGIYVHKGFDSTSKDVYNDVKPFLNKDFTIICTGHSLGAAISTLLMIRLEIDGFKLGQSINFGQLKITNKTGAIKYSKLPLLRVVDRKDLVPLCPPATLLDSIHGTYRHFGREALLLNGKHFSYLEEHDAERFVASDFWSHIGEKSLKDHYMENYIANIEGKIKSGSVEIPYSDRAKFE